MSEEQLKAFIAKVQADTSLQEQLKAEGADPVAIAKAAGFAITEAEVKAYGETRDLSDDELESVAGGYVDMGWADPRERHGEDPGTVEPYKPDFEPERTGKIPWI